MTRRSRSLAFALACLALAVLAPASADPPPWAPAHGWRKKHDPYYQGYSGKKWKNDYGVSAGHCDRKAVGAVVGGALGASVGSQIGKGDGQKLAILVGTAIGAYVGTKVAEKMTNADAGCIGHSLELAGDRKPVSWTGEGGTKYRLEPRGGFDRNGTPCRKFVLTVNGKSSEQRACQREPGAWELV